MNAANLAICFGYVSPFPPSFLPSFPAPSPQPPFKKDLLSLPLSLSLLSRQRPSCPSEACQIANTSMPSVRYRPTLMHSHTGPNIADAGWQVRVIDTILQNTYQIFDDD